MDKGTCSISDCDRKVTARGWCQTHWKRWRTGADMNAPIKAAATAAIDLPDGRRVCKRCQQPKEIRQFDVDTRAKTGRRADCKECRSSYMKSYYESHAEDRRAYMRDRLAANPDHVRALDAARYERDKDKRVALATAAYHLRQARIASRPYDKGISTTRLRRRDGEKCRYCGCQMVFESFSNEKRPPNLATIEHVVPVSAGGSHTWENVTLARWRCNSSKRAQAVEDLEVDDDHFPLASRLTLW